MEITVRELDKLKKPFSVKSTLALCLKNSLGSVLRADPRADDFFVDVPDDNGEDEPIAPPIDNFTAGHAKLNKKNNISDEV